MSNSASLPLPTSSTTTSCLRSCLSPSRARSSSPDSYHHSPLPPSSSNSRSTSFSSNSSGYSDSCSWGKRTKSVRWQEENGCAVTSTHHTYSQEEYDRTPLEPPSVAERDCVLPERGSRCLSSYRDCFYSDLTDEEEYPPCSSSSTTDSSFFLHTPPPTEENSDVEDEDVDADCGGGGDEEWEECMERRRMMFARMCPLSPKNEDGHHPEFEGYRSISSTLANLLRSVSCDDDDDDDDVQDQDEEKEEEEQSISSTPIAENKGFLKSSTEGLSLSRFVTREREDEDEVEEEDVDTPSMTSGESEADLSLVSPSEVSSAGFLPLIGLPSPLLAPSSQPKSTNNVNGDGWSALMFTTTKTTTTTLDRMV